MEKYLRPERFDGDPAVQSTAKEWGHWKKTFVNFLAASTTKDAQLSNETKLQLLVNHISPKVYSYISECANYDYAIAALDSIFVKPNNILTARHVLTTRRQQPSETVDMYLQSLKQLAKDCEFKEVDAETNKNDTIRGAFISGLASSKIRSRLLESLTLTLETTYNTARAMEMAEINSQNFVSSTVSALPEPSHSTPVNEENPTTVAVSSKSNSSGRKCFFCGGAIHLRRNCPARESICKNCDRKGHFAKVCRSSAKATSASADTSDKCDHCSACIVAATPASLRKAVVPAYVKGVRGNALIDTGSSVSFINEDYANLCNLKRIPCTQTVSMASLSHTCTVKGQVRQNIIIGNNSYDNTNLLIVKNLCADLIIGHDVLENHSSLELVFGGPKEVFKVCCVTEASVPAPLLFLSVTPDCKPIAIKSRRHSSEDLIFIKNEVKKLLDEGIIEESRSPWRAQVLITRNETHKKRLVIDYSQTVNRYTQLDSYPLPNIEETVSKVSQHKVFSTIDLQSAYHQVPILPRERIFTAFEAAGNLFQFRRIPFGVTNGVASFQRTIDWLIRKEDLKGTYAYLDDITICGQTQAEHDANLENFMKAAEKYKLTLNKLKSKFNLKVINLLGYTIGPDHLIKPDRERLQPLLKMAPPNDLPSLRRVLGMFAHYSKWIPNFSQRIHTLAHTVTFPLTEEAVSCFESLKYSIAASTVRAIDEQMPFTVETDASEHSIAATLCQESRPVAFFSRSLTASELKHSAVEKEAYAIVESLKKWRHYLIGKPFTVITDQKSVSFMFDNKHSSKIKNEKIQRWRLELAPYKYEIVYRPGKENQAADALSRICSCATSTDTSKLRSLHEALCHPGITRMFHWLKTKNLPYSLEEVKRMTKDCTLCNTIKPRYFKNTEPFPKLIKATSPFERLSIDFKGPVPSNTSNRYILTVIDEYSRFPFAFPCSDISANTVVKHLNNLFMIFGMPAYVHSDRGTQFLSAEVRDFLHSKGVATSRTTAYNPQGNGQCEKLNGTIWKAVQLACGTHNAQMESWERFLPVALHSIRSLLCTATNCTPHERMFKHTRRSPNGNTIPTWLTESGQVLLKRFNRNNKYEPLVEEVELLQANPDYSFVRFHDGRETTISNRHLAPIGRQIEGELIDPSERESHTEDERDSSQNESPETFTTPLNSPLRPNTLPDSSDHSEAVYTPIVRATPPHRSSTPLPEAFDVPAPRRSGRVRKPPRYLEDYSVGE